MPPSPHKLREKFSAWREKRGPGRKTTHSKRNVVPRRPDDPPEVISSPHAIAIADFVPEREEELGVKERDIVGLIRRAGKGWYYACSWDNKRVGYIHRNFLNVRIDIPPAPEPVRPLEVLRDGSAFSDSAGKKHHICAGTAGLPPGTTPIPSRAALLNKKLRDDSDIFLLVIETYEPESEDDIGAKEGDILISLDKRVKLGRPLLEDWIYCMNVTGRRGIFPGSFADILYSPEEIDKRLQNYPHAIATRTIRYPLDGCVRIDVGEAFYMEPAVGDSIFGRTASGFVGKLALDDCSIIVPP